MVEYDNNGRMKYNPEYHVNKNKAYTMGELSYICKNYRMGTRKQLSMATGRTEGALGALVYKLKKEGTFSFYRDIEMGEEF